MQAAAYSAVTRTSPTNIAVTVTALASGAGVLATGAQYALKEGDGSYGPWINYTLSATPTSTLTLGGLTAGATYKVRLVGFNTSPITGSSTVIPGTESAESADIVLFIATPTTPILTVQGSSINVTVTHVTGVSRYIIQRSDSTSFMPYIDVCTNVTRIVTGFNDYFSFVEGNTYYYRIIAVTTNGTQSSAGPAASIVFPSRPGAPTITSASAVRDRYVGIYWKAPVADGGSPVAAYYIEKSTDNSIWGVVAQNISYQTTSYLVSGLSPSTKYYFRISARNARGLGPASDPVICSTP